MPILARILKDRGIVSEKQLEEANLGELMVLVQRVPRAYMRLIRQRIDEARKQASPAPA